MLRINLRYLKHQCNVHGCHALNQLHLLFRVGKADTFFELLLVLLDEALTSKVSRSLPTGSGQPGPATKSTLFKLMTSGGKAWPEKERWAGRREVIDRVRTEWDQAQLCVKASLSQLDHLLHNSEEVNPGGCAWRSSGASCVISPR